MKDNIVQLAERGPVARLRRILVMLDEQEGMLHEVSERVHALREATAAKLKKLQSTNATDVPEASMGDFVDELGPD